MTHAMHNAIFVNNRPQHEITAVTETEGIAPYRNIIAVSDMMQLGINTVCAWRAMGVDLYIDLLTCRNISIEENRA